MLLLKNYSTRRNSTFQPRKRADAYHNRADSSDSESELSQDPESDSESEDEVAPIKGKLYKQNEKKLHRYFTPGTGREVIEDLTIRDRERNNQRGSLDSQKLDIKKIEYRKKIDIVWNSIISKYSAFDEDDQGDVINLKDFSIEEDTGHIEKLQTFQRTSIWNDINQIEGPDDYEERMDPSEDPINLLTNGKTSRERSKRSSLHNSRTTTPPPLIKSVPKKTTTTKSSEILNNDPLSLLTPRKTSRITTRSSSPRKAQTRLEPSSPVRHRRQSSPSKLMAPSQTTDMHNDPLALLTQRKTTKSSSPSRNAPSTRGISQLEPGLASPMSLMAPPSSTRLSASRREATRPLSPPISSPPELPKDSIDLLSPRRPHRPSSPTPGLRTRAAHHRRSEPIRSNQRQTREPTGRHSSPVRQLMATFPSIEPIQVFKRPEMRYTPTQSFRRPQKRRAPFEHYVQNKTHKVQDGQAPKRHSSPVRKLMDQLLSSKPPSTGPDPINLLTPRTTTRVGSRITTRASSPIRSTRRTPSAVNEADPICLLTPRSSIRKGSSSRRTTSSSQFQPIQEDGTLPPPPPYFPIPQQSAMNVASSTEYSPFIMPPPPPPPMHGQQLYPLPMLNPFMFGYPMMHYLPYNQYYGVGNNGSIETGPTYDLMNLQRKHVNK